MKILKNYNEFVKESYSPINEGGGAGKEFTFENPSFEIEYEYKDGTLTEISNTFELGDKVDIVGYERGEREIDVEGLFTSDDKMVCKFDLTTAEKLLNIIGADLSESHTFSIVSSRYISKYSTMIGRGWIPFRYDVGDEVLPEYIVDDYDFYIDNKDIDNMDQYIKLNSELSEDLVSYPSMKATSTFVELWDRLFMNNDEDDDEGFKTDDFELEDEE